MRRIGSKKAIFRRIRSELGEIFRRPAEQKESRIEEGYLMISIPLKYAVAQVVGFIKGKSATHIARRYAEVKRNFAEQRFWARGYFVSKVGRDEEVIREYIRHQEREDRRRDQMELM